MKNDDASIRIKISWCFANMCVPDRLLITPLHKSFSSFHSRSLRIIKGQIFIKVTVAIYCSFRLWIAFRNRDRDIYGSINWTKHFACYLFIYEARFIEGSSGRHDAFVISLWNLKRWRFAFQIINPSFFQRRGETSITLTFNILFQIEEYSRLLNLSIFGLVSIF